MRFVFSLTVAVVQLIISVSAYAEEQFVSVESITRNISITGFTRASAKMPLTTEVEGKVSAVFADIGDSILANKVFACLDDTFVQIDIKLVQKEMSRHYVDIKYYKKEVSRYQKLVNKQTVAVSALDSLMRDLSNAREALAIASIRKQRLEEEKRRHCIEAPEGWKVIDRSIEIGQWVRQGEVVAKVGNYSQLSIPLILSQQELASLNKNKDNIELILSGNNLKIPASIEYISPAFDEKTRKILVNLLIKQSLAELHGGMRVELILKTSGSKGASFFIDKRALEERFEEYWLQRKDGKRIRVKLLTEQANGTVTISSREIKLGDQFKIISF